MHTKYKLNIMYVESSYDSMHSTIIRARHMIGRTHE